MLAMTAVPPSIGIVEWVEQLCPSHASRLSRAAGPAQPKPRSGEGWCPWPAVTYFLNYPNLWRF